MSTPGALLFHVHRMDGTVTGPHAVGVIRRGLQSGEFGPDTPLCLLGTEDWLPLSEWQSEIDGPPPAPQRASGLSPAAAHWISQQADSPAKRGPGPIRIFFGVILYLMALALIPPALGGIAEGEYFFVALSVVFCIPLFWTGTRLMSARPA